MKMVLWEIFSEGFLTLRSLWCASHRHRPLRVIDTVKAYTLNTLIQGASFGLHPGYAAGMSVQPPVLSAKFFTIKLLLTSTLSN
jgi:hypothetical protein